MTARTRKPFRVTAALLARHDACPDQVNLFRRTFPKGCAVTLASARKAVKAGLDLDWFAETFLSAPARAAYEQATAPALVKAWDRGKGAKP